MLKAHWILTKLLHTILHTCAKIWSNKFVFNLLPFFPENLIFIVFFKY